MGCCGCESEDGEANEPKQEFAKRRGCTDVCCLIIFAIFLFILIIFSAFAIVYGDPKRLVNGFDSFGNVCGSKGPKLGNMTFTGLDMTDRRYVFFFDVNDVFKTLKLCVKQCPDMQLNNQGDLMKFGQSTGSLLCRYNVPLENYKKNDPLVPGSSGSIPASDLWKHVCPSLPVYKSVPILNRCVPKATSKLAIRTVYNIHAYLNDVELFQQILSDFYASWFIMLGLTLAAFVLSFVVTVFMYLFTFVLSWIFMIILAVGSVAVTGVLWYTYIDTKKQLDHTPPAELLEESARNEQAFLVFSVIATIFTIVLLLVIFFMRKQVRMLTKLFKIASECIQDMPCLLLQPIWTFLALFAFFAFWVFVMLSLATSNTPTRENITHSFSPNPSNSQGNSPLVGKPLPQNITELHSEFTSIQYNQVTWVKYSWWLFVFALIWVSEFILACQQMVIAGAAAFWYFQRDKQRLRYPIARSLRHLFLYHMGSLALGSFLITMLKIPRLILAYLETKLNQYKEGGKCVDCAHCCLRCCYCCFWCLQKFIKFVNHNAYTIIVFKGYSFCPAAKIAFESIMKNILKVSFVNSVGDAILFFGKCAVTVVMAFTGLLIMKNDPNLHFYAVPIFVVCVFSFFIAHCFLSVFEMVVDTLLLCFCEDFVNEDDQGDGERKMYASEAMQTYLKQVSAELENKSIAATGNDRSEEPPLKSDPVSL